MRQQIGIALLTASLVAGVPLAARADGYPADFGLAGAVKATGNRMTVTYFGWESTTYYGHTIWAMTTQDYQDNLGHGCFSYELNPAACDTRKGVPLFTKPFVEAGATPFDPATFGPRTLTLSDYFPAQSEVVFVMQVNQGGVYNWFFSGDPSRNGDGKAHLALFGPAGVPVHPGESPTVDGTPGHALYGFEDVFYGSSDWDFNNALFALSFDDDTGNPTETPTPEPATLTLLAGGLTGLAAFGRRRRGHRDGG